jgi:hypothetical protein
MAPRRNPALPARATAPPNLVERLNFFTARRDRIELSLNLRVLSQSHQWETNNAMERR